MARTVKTQTLDVAAGILGGTHALAEELEVPAARLAGWLAGLEDPPEAAFLSALALVLDYLDDADGRPGNDALPPTG